MAIKKEPGAKWHSKPQLHHEHHKTPDELAPPEEQGHAQSGRNGSNNGGGGVIGDAGDLNLPSEFTEKGAKERQILGLEPMAFFIVAFAVIFICFIAYLISIEPPKTDEESKPVVEAQPK